MCLLMLMKTEVHLGELRSRSVQMQDLVKCFEESIIAMFENLISSSCQITSNQSSSKTNTNQKAQQIQNTRLIGQRVSLEVNNHRLPNDKYKC